jgi:hypothetical protein
LPNSEFPSKETAKRYSDDENEENHARQANSQQVYDKEERKKRHSSAKKSSASLSARLQQRQREKERQRESPGEERDLVMIEKNFSSYQIDSSFVMEEEEFQPVDVYADGKKLLLSNDQIFN